MTPAVSIITPSYNSARFIAETIKSVLNQSFTNWEMIIVDDCSTDDTVEIIRSFADERIRLHILTQNSGAGIARNTALQMASGRYIAFLDADDLWKSTKLEKQISFMQEHHQPFTFSFYDCIDENGNDLHRTVMAPQPLTYHQLFFCNFVGNLTGIYDSQIFGKIEITKVRKRQDWIMWLSILKTMKTAQVVPESLAYYRIRKNSISSSKKSLMGHNYNVYRQYHHLSIFTSTLCMFGFLFTQLLIKPRYIIRRK